MSSITTAIFNLILRIFVPKKTKVKPLYPKESYEPPTPPVKKKIEPKIEIMQYTKIIGVSSTDTEAVKAIKQKLNELSGSTLDVNNGNFGSSTALEVMRFQKSRNLLADGVVGELTWNTLFAIIPDIPATVSANTLSARAIEIAKTQLNVREATGKNDGAAVESYLKSVGLGKGYAWCAAFTYWCFNQAAKDLGVTNPLIGTAGVLDHWRRADNKYKFSSPKTGDIFIMDFGKGAGHTGIVTDVKGDKVFTIEGNTGADPSTPASDREGDGVYKRSRKISAMKGFIRY